MPQVLERLVEQLALERLEVDLFRGQSKDPGWGIVFGGQVLGQALSAAVQTVDGDRFVHSMHAYFLRPGDVSKPIIYEVDRIRDGKSFATRRVVAVQSGQAIFNMAASFQVSEGGFAHQDAMPVVPAPESLPGELERAQPFAHKLPKPYLESLKGDRAFEMRWVSPEHDMFEPRTLPPDRMLWMRATGTLPDDRALHAYLLAYASDFAFVTTALQPHGMTWYTPGLQVASIDHAMWYHEPFRVDDWLLYVIHSPRTFGARGLVHGSVFTRDGRLVVSTAQEGLMRKHERGTSAK
jgi:acyl-CoA thioesterase II